MSQPTSTQKTFRPLPQGAKTRDEIRALVEKHGFLTETQVLEHINKFCKQPWTHEDFVNFFVLSDQMVFQEKNGRLYLAPNRVETSDEGVNDEANSMSTRSQTSQNQSQIDTAGLSRQSDRDVGSIDTEDSSAAESERRRDELPSVGQMPSNYTSDEDSGEGDQPSLTINDVVQMKRARRRHFRAADPEKWVTLDPGKSNRVPTKIRLSSSDSSDDSEG